MNSNPPSPPSTWAPGQLVPGTSYRVVRPLGQGGMGEVFEVEHDMLGKRAALKVLARELSYRTDLGNRLRAEARTLARLSHPNLVEVYDLGTASDARIFFTMELLDGLTLRDLLRREGKLSPDKAVFVIAQALDGLAAAHSTHLVHRDIKPENLFVCRSCVVKLLDFGIAKAIDASTAGITESGMAIGTPWYMSPEQTRAMPVDQRTDVYAAGLVLWEAISGRRAFSGDDYEKIVRAKHSQGAPPLDARLGVPQALASAVSRACSPEPADRFPTAAAFAAAIRSAVGQPVQPHVGQQHRVTFDFPEPPPQPRLPEKTEQDQGSRGLPTRPDRPRDGGGRVADEGMATLHLEAPAPVDRDAPTCAHPAVMLPGIGPTGTAMLPAVAAQLAPTISAPATQPSNPPPPMPAQAPAAAPVSNDRDRETSPPAQRTSAIVVVAAFLVPVAIASLIGLFVMRNDRGTLNTAPSQPGPTEPVVSIASAVSSPPAASASQSAPQDSVPAASSSARAEIPAASTPPKIPSKTAQSVAGSPATAMPAATTIEPAPVPTPPKPAAKKTARPASGL